MALERPTSPLRTRHRVRGARFFAAPPHQFLIALRVRLALRLLAQRPPEPEAGRAKATDGRFAGKVVLITGATSGIGEGTAQAFAHEGAKVYFCGRRENLGVAVENGIRDAGGEATYRRADVRREEEVRTLVEGCVSTYGRLDIAFNNAGIVNSRLVRLHEQSADDFLDVLHTNTLGEFLCLKYELPVMFLASDDASAWHGSNVDVTSGMLD